MTGTDAETSGKLNCKCCKKKVVNGLKCNECGIHFHINCAKKVNVKFLDDNTIKCCDESERVKEESECINDDDIVFMDALNDISDENNKIDIRIVKYILQQKDSIISELRERIQIMTQHTELLSKCVQSENLKNVKIMESSLKQIESNGENSELSNKLNVECVRTGNQMTYTSKEATTNVTNVPGMEKHKVNISNNNNNDNSHNSGNNVKLTNAIVSNNQQWTEVVKRKPKRVTVIGNKEGRNDYKLQGVPKIISLHVYRLAPDTKSESVVDFLKQYFPEIKCEKLTARHPDLYSSFKIDIYEEHESVAMDPSLWPRNTCIRRFLYLRPKQIQNQV